VPISISSSRSIPFAAFRRAGRDLATRASSAPR